MVPAPSRSLPFSASLSLSLSLCLSPSCSHPLYRIPVYPSASIVGSFRYARPPFTLVNANAVSCFNFPSPHKTERRTCRPFCVLARFLPFSSARTPRSPVPLLLILLADSLSRPSLPLRSCHSARAHRTPAYTRCISLSRASAALSSRT